MFSKMPVDCHYFNLGDTKEYEHYDDIVVDKESVYYRLRTSTVLKEGDKAYE